MAVRPGREPSRPAPFPDRVTSRRAVWSAARQVNLNKRTSHPPNPS